MLASHVVDVGLSIARTNSVFTVWICCSAIWKKKSKLIFNSNTRILNISNKMQLVSANWFANSNRNNQNNKKETIKPSQTYTISWKHTLILRLAIWIHGKLSDNKSAVQSLSISLIYMHIWKQSIACHNI